MLEKIILRDATEADLPAIVAIYNATIPGRMVTADISEVTVDERKPWLRAHLANKSRPLWVAELDGAICGWLSLSSFYGRPAYHATCEISIYIHERYRRKGIGGFLIEETFHRCASMDIRTLLAFIFGHNAPSLNLFKHFGFEQWGFLPEVAEIDGIKRDLVILGRLIGK